MLVCRTDFQPAQAQLVHAPVQLSDGVGFRRIHRCPAFHQVGVLGRVLRHHVIGHEESGGARLQAEHHHVVGLAGGGQVLVRGRVLHV